MMEQYSKVLPWIFYTKNPEKNVSLFQKNIKQTFLDIDDNNKNGFWRIMWRWRLE